MGGQVKKDEKKSGCRFSLRSRLEKSTRTVPQDVTETADPTVIVIGKDAKAPAVPVVLLEVVLHRRAVRPGAQVLVLVHPDHVLVTKKILIAKDADQTVEAAPEAVLGMTVIPEGTETGIEIATTEKTETKTERMRRKNPKTKKMKKLQKRKKTRYPSPLLRLLLLQPPNPWPRPKA